MKEKLITLIDAAFSDGQLEDEEYEGMLAIVERGTQVSDEESRVRAQFRQAITGKEQL